MDFLQTILGADLFAQVKKAIDEHNGNDSNKDKQIKLANLGGGEYVAKGKHDALQASLDSKVKELQQANDLITQLKKDSEGNEGIQNKITDYEQQVTQLQAELQATKLRAAVKVALLSEKAVDIDYLTFKLNESLSAKGEKLELDDKDQIKGWDSKIKALKTQFPKLFTVDGEGGEYKPLDGERLPEGDEKTVTKEEFRKMGYDERLKLKQENEELFRQLNN